MGFRSLFVSALAIAATLVTCIDGRDVSKLGVHARRVSKRASLQPVSNFGDNPTGVKMYIYVPTVVAPKPPIIVAIHYCNGTAEGYYEQSPYAGLADQYGFIVIYPESPFSGRCWDVSSAAALTHGSGADSNSIANMVTYTLAQYNGDASRVFVTGTSSGAMMTNVLAATYPEMFAAATVYSGVPAGCFYTGTVDGWNATCSEGDSIHTQAEWAQTAEAMYPGYTGSRPKMLIFHGSADVVLYPPNFNETLKQWTGVFGYSMNPVSVQANYPSAVYTKYTYGPNVAGIYGIGIGHTVPTMGDQDMAWFGITAGASGGSVPSAATTTSLQTTTAPQPAPTLAPSNPAPTVACAPMYGQCGGMGFTGPTCCSAGTCHASNAYYSQCF